VDGIDLLGGLREFKHNVDETKFIEEVELTIERIYVKSQSLMRLMSKPKHGAFGPRFFVVGVASRGVVSSTSCGRVC
jgi:hypothetical protein